MNKAFFLDRDGVIDEMAFDDENGMAHPPRGNDQVVLAPNIASLLKITKELGYLNIIISNQPDIGLERITKNGFKEIEKTINDKLEKEGALIDKAYYCFHHPFAKIDEYRLECDCRKPKTSLFHKAVKEFDIDLKKSWMIGDGVNDIIAGHNVGCRTILISHATLETSYYKKLKEKLGEVESDFIVKNIKEAISVIENNP
jgi:D-glycero-D-manno-heptose 1,7-bisphosphate phosphatase